MATLRCIVRARSRSLRVLDTLDPPDRVSQTNPPGRTGFYERGDLGADFRTSPFPGEPRPAATGLAKIGETLFRLPGDETSNVRNFELDPRALVSLQPRYSEELITPDQTWPKS